jgi:hypothetical protein
VQRGKLLKRSKQAIIQTDESPGQAGVGEGHFASCFFQRTPKKPARICSSASRGKTKMV